MKKVIKQYKASESVLDVLCDVAGFYLRSIWTKAKYESPSFGKLLVDIMWSGWHLPGKAIVQLYLSKCNITHDEAVFIVLHIVTQASVTFKGHN